LKMDDSISTAAPATVGVQPDRDGRPDAHEHGPHCAHGHAHAGCAEHDHSHDHAHPCPAHAAPGAGAAHACSSACAHRPESSVEADSGPAPYELVGGDAGVRRLVDRFYDLMDLEPRFSDLRALHPATLEGSRDKLYWFLSGWMGGPDLYSERVGPAMLRARHLPYPINSQARDQWLICMGMAMMELGFEEPLFERLLQGFYGTADWMRNAAD